MSNDPLAIKIPSLDGPRQPRASRDDTNGNRHQPRGSTGGTPQAGTQPRPDPPDARGYNLLIWIGRLATEPEIRTAASGTRFLRVRCLQDQPDRNGQAGVQGVEVALFNERAEAFTGRFHKGDEILVKGRLALEVNRDRDGIFRVTASVHPEGKIRLLHRPQRHSSDG